MDPNPEDKITPRCDKGITGNRFQSLMGCDRMKELLCVGKYSEWDSYPPLKIPFQDLFRFWWNRRVQQEYVADEILEDIFTYFTALMLPPQKEAPHLDLTLVFQEVPLFLSLEHGKTDGHWRQTTEALMVTQMPGVKRTFDLLTIRAWFDIPKRYSQHNKEMVEACDLLHAFIRAEDGFIGGTRFEVEYAASFGIPVEVHRENGPSQWIFQYSFPLFEGKEVFFLAWEGFFHKIRLDLGGSS